MKDYAPAMVRGDWGLSMQVVGKGGGGGDVLGTGKSWFRLPDSLIAFW